MCGVNIFNMQVCGVCGVGLIYTKLVVGGGLVLIYTVCRCSMVLRDEVGVKDAMLY